jgi:lipoic acid synthetase
MTSLRSRWLGSVTYPEATDLMDVLFREHGADYLLLLEHLHVFTCGRNTHADHLLWDEDERARRRVAVCEADRGGDVTYHGPGQLVAYPIVRLADPNPVGYLRRLEDVLIRTVADFGVTARRFPPYTGIWVGDAKIAAIGVKVRGDVTKHGIALNVDPDLSYFGGIVPCGISDYGVTSLRALLAARAPTVRDVAARFRDHFAAAFGYTEVDDAAEEPYSHIETGGLTIGRKLERPAWMKVRARMGPEYMELRSLMRGLDLHTVCEEAGCPNIYECWDERTATLMILGDHCTRACGFCRVATGKPLGLDKDEPARAARAVAQMGLAHAVITSVARDDLADGGAAVFAATIRAIREQVPGCGVEVLVPDFKGSREALELVLDAQPEVVNHNIETVARLQKPVRKSMASYGRTLTLLARAHRAGLTTKSGIILGMGETFDEVVTTMRDLRAVGADILTVGQYLQPTNAHIRLRRWWTPEEFDALAETGRDLGFAHVEAGPLVRSSYHARKAASVGV